MIIDMSNGFHFRPERGGSRWRGDYLEETPGYKTEFENLIHRENSYLTADRAPMFESLAAIPRAWAGLYEMTPDHHAILEPVAEAPGFFCRERFQRSRRDARTGQAQEEFLSDLILHGSTNLIDASGLDLECFAEGRVIEETAML